MKLFYVLLALFFTLPTFSQTLKIAYDSRLEEIFTLDYLNKVAETNPILIKKWTFNLDNSYYIADYLPKKFAKNLPLITISDLKNINILKLEKEQNIRKDWNLPTAYKIKNTAKVLVYHSGKQLNKQFREVIGGY